MGSVLCDELAHLIDHPPDVGARRDQVLREALAERGDELVEQTPRLRVSRGQLGSALGRSQRIVEMGLRQRGLGAVHLIDEPEVPLADLGLVRIDELRAQDPQRQPLLRGEPARGQGVGLGPQPIERLEERRVPRRREVVELAVEAVIAERSGGERPAQAPLAQHRQRARPEDRGPVAVGDGPQVVRRRGLGRDGRRLRGNGERWGLGDRRRRTGDGAEGGREAAGLGHGGAP